jgi:putative aldouronate transport system substrate-binding protein
MIYDMYAGPPTETMKTRGEFLQKMELEMFVRIITGDAPLDDFDKFVEDWKSLGGSEITKEVNAWYQSVK